MEDKKNNALEKAENIASSSEKKNKTKKTAPKKAKAKKQVANKAKKLKQKEERKKALLEKREQKEKEMAKIRLEKAKEKAHKKAEKEKAKATALREKNRKREEAKILREKLKAEKKERRDLIKKESKQQREKRLKEEKTLRLEHKKAEKERKAELKRQKFLAKKDRKNQRQKNRQKNKNARRGFGGWLAAVISLGVVSLILASVLTVTFMMPEQADTALEASYQKSFYETVAEVDNIDLNLSKALATSDQRAMQNYLVDLAINAELAENSLQQLPLKDENKFYTTKLVNQIGDYAKFLNKKLINNQPITEEEYQALARLYKSNLALKNALNTMTTKMNGDFSFSNMQGEDNAVISGFNELENLSVEYPELIYDGPFSDGRERIMPKGLTGEEISDSLALQKFNAYFAKYNLSNVKNVGMLEGNLKCYNVQGEGNGLIVFAQISQTGGKLVMFDMSGSCNNVEIAQDTAVEVATEFIKNTGIENIAPVWVNLANNVYTINFASIKDGVVIYPDLIKARVCAETGMVIGLEATSYYYNHTERVISQPEISKTKALNSVSSNISVDDSRLAVVPIGENSEKLCYEFVGTYNGSTYYVYIDAINGKQIEMFKVIESAEGSMLM